MRMWVDKSLTLGDSKSLRDRAVKDRSTGKGGESPSWDCRTLLATKSTGSGGLSPWQETSDIKTM